MADIKWPVGLRPSLRASKSRQEVVGFRESQPTVGPSFIEPFSEDTPSFYDVEFIFTTGEARTFQAWLAFHQMKTYAPFFDFPLVIEDPNVDTQEARFLLDGYPKLTGNNVLYKYSAKLLIRKLDRPDDANAEFILQLGESTGYKPTIFSSGLDIAINSEYS
ncbi:hypothetical protein N9980_00505 [bacterium]|nr:hypothetical protein [bacterium]